MTETSLVYEHLVGCIGTQLKIMRLQRGVSQQTLGERLGVSYQQIQKYESGNNRISAARLYQCAKILETPIGRLFPDDTFEIKPDIHGHMNALMQTFCRLKSAHRRLTVIDVAEGLFLLQSRDRTAPFLDVRPMRNVQDSDGRFCSDVCTPEEAEFWSVVVRLENGECDWQGDFLTEMDAIDFVEELRHVYPELQD